MKKINFDKMTVETLKVLRGSQSQQTLSHKLGYTYNQFYRWESLRRHISWLEFIEVAKVRKNLLSGP